MTNTILRNSLLTVEISAHGAELQSIRDNRTGHEYLWQGDAAFWGRRSPVLFPIVGAVWEGRFHMDGREFAMGQHGFARDRDFTAMPDAASDTEAWFALESDQASEAVYPRRFRLEIGYRLDGERLSVMWRVINRDSREMCFQIGAHPAFNYPEFNAGEQLRGYFAFDRRPERSQVIESGGCVGEELVPVAVDGEGMLPITADTFRRDALILADGNVHRVSLLGPDRTPYLSLLFDAPLVGLWSPSAAAPFVCIEPWYGRCDRVGFNGEFSDREHVCRMAPGSTFESTYSIIIERL